MSAWSGDHRLSWQVVLVAELDEPPVADVVAGRLARLGAREQWPSPLPVTAEVDGNTLRISGHHAYVDGLALLRVLEELSGTPVTARARGIGDRPPRCGPLRGDLERLVEVFVGPPARVPPTRRRRAEGDAYAAVDLAGALDTASLAEAAVRALPHGPGVALAVGVSRSGGDATAIRDDSALLRLRGAESAADLRSWLREAAPEPPPVPPGHGLLARFMGLMVALAHRLLWRRLGSTVLVSHLGRVDAPGVRRLRFHPVTGGGSALALGAVTLNGTTTLTLRGRAADHDRDGLEGLLEAVARAASG